MECLICNKEKTKEEMITKNKCKKCKYSVIKEKRKQNKIHLLKRRGNTCEDCKLKFDGENIYFFTFHHINPKNKSFELSSPKNYSMKELEDEVDKCIILCHNCHNKFHYINGFS